MKPLFFANKKKRTMMLKPIKETKITLSGSLNTGKTSVFKRLTQGNSCRFDKNEMPTVGVNIATLPTSRRPPINMNFWDFSGSAVFSYANHLLMPRNGGIHVLVTNEHDFNREYSQLTDQLDYFAAWQETPTVIVALNKIDEFSATTPTFNLFESEDLLNNKYPKLVKNLYLTSAKNRKHTNQLRMGLNQAAKTQVKAMEWPDNWFMVKDILASTLIEFMSEETYAQLCQAHGITDVTEYNQLAMALHNAGVLIHFNHIDFPEMYVMNPTWLTLPMYQMIQHAAQFNGIVDLTNFRLKNSIRKKTYQYDGITQAKIIELMQKLALCYNKAGQLIFPESFKKNQSVFVKDFFTSAALKVTIHYHGRMIPRLILNRLKVHLNQWLDGDILQVNGTKVLVAEIENTLSISIVGQHKNQALTGIMNVLQTIYQLMGFDIKKLVREENLHIPGHPGCTVNYRDVLGLKAVGEKTIAIGGVRARLSIEHLLNS